MKTKADVQNSFLCIVSTKKPKMLQKKKRQLPYNQRTAFANESCC